MPVCVSVWCCCSNAFSGQKLFTEGSIQLYNVLFTTAPLLLYGMWDRDVTYEHALKVRPNHPPHHGHPNPP